MTELYRPTPWGESCNFHYWSDQHPLKQPKTPGLSYIPRDQAENGKTRVDVNDSIASRNLRFFGYVGEIKQGASGNTATPYGIYIIGRLMFWETLDHGRGPS